MTTRRNILPGFGISTGFTLAYMSLIILIPLSAVFLKTATVDWHQFWTTITAPRLITSFKLTLTTSLVSALLNAAFGLLVAWVLARYRFPGKSRVPDSLSRFLHCINNFVYFAFRDEVEVVGCTSMCNEGLFFEVVVNNFGKISSPNLTHWTRMKIWDGKNNWFTFFTPEEETGLWDKYLLSDLTEEFFHTL